MHDAEVMLDWTRFKILVCSTPCLIHQAGQAVVALCSDDGSTQVSDAAHFVQVCKVYARS